MPHKSGTKIYYKSSAGYVHPSLRSPSERSASPSSVSWPILSVNEQIHHLRRTQTPRIRDNQDISGPEVEVPPSIGRRRPAGPEPRSWSASRQVGPLLVDIRTKSDLTTFECFKRLDHLPGIRVPEKTSLLHIVLKQLAVTFEFHLEYDHVFLSTLPVELKSMLLSYIATYASERSLINISALRLLLNHDPAAEKESHSDSLDRLDLGSSIGNSLSLVELRKYWMTPVERTSDILPDSWEDEEIPRSVSSIRFPALTKLSLAHPSSSASWPALLSLSRNLKTITHLSLAYWPIPSLPIVENTDNSHQSLNQSDRNLRVHHDDVEALEEAAAILKQLSRNTTSLHWLSFEGCGAWFRALRYGLTMSHTGANHSNNASNGNAAIDPDATGNGGAAIRLSRPSRTYNAAFISPVLNSATPPASTTGPEWTHAWRHVKYVNLMHGSLPSENHGPSSAMHAPDALGATYSRLHERNSNNPAWIAADGERSRPRYFGESYVFHTPSEEVARSVMAPYERKLWWEFEREAARVALEVRSARTRAGGVWCLFDMG